ncbi:Lipoma HMGIC fusion partner-like protein [Mactra antiquata]
MCQVIITCRSLLWTLLTIATTQILIASVMSPQWMIGYERKPGLISFKDLNNKTISDGGNDMYRPTIGIINRCTRLHKFQNILKTDNCATFVTDFGMNNDEFPDAWKASFIFFCIGGILMVYTMGASVMSICVQSMCGKSIFGVSGFIQSIAGLFCVIGLFVYPVGWSSKKVQFYCGEQSTIYSYDQCSLGWSFYMCIVAIILVFVCSVLSIGAERATTCRKVEEEVVEGKALICVMA